MNWLELAQSTSLKGREVNLTDNGLTTISSISFVQIRDGQVHIRFRWTKVLTRGIWMKARRTISLVVDGSLEVYSEDDGRICFVLFPDRKFGAIMPVKQTSLIDSFPSA